MGAGDITSLLRAVPRPSRVQVEFVFDANALRRSMATMVAKAPGPDNWAASDLLRMPDKWWHHAAQLWDKVVELRRTPLAGTAGKTCLIWKDSTKTRPITILPAIWRAGARLLNEQLHGWVRSWCQSFDCGGLAETSVATALQQLQHELDHHACGAIQQDIAGFFDSLDHKLTAQVLRHLRAWASLVALVEHVWATGRRLFSLEGALGTGWQCPGRGLPQGCPLSPLISATVTHVWACYVFGAQHSAQDPVTGHGYVDDRLMLLRAHGTYHDLRQAVERSNIFDRGFGLEVAVTKCAVLARGNDGEARDLAATLRYKFGSELRTLGVKVSFEGHWGLLRFSPEKCIQRLRAIRSLQLSIVQVKPLVRSLVLPCIAWAAPYASPDAADITRLAAEIEACLEMMAGHGAAKVLFYEIIGWELEPQFAVDLAILRAFWRTSCRPDAWTESLPLTELGGYAARVLPQLQPTLARLGWWISEDTRTISCHDEENALRTLHLGRESFKRLREWLAISYRRLYFHKTWRVWHHHPRPEDHATGLQLPVPDADLDYRFEGHKRAYKEAGNNRELQLAVVGAGASNWHFNAGGNFDPDRHRCPCGGLRPSRPHLVWNCSHFEGLRGDLAPPRDKAAERLFALPVGRLPRAPACIDAPGFHDELVDAVAGHAHRRRVVVATDGSSKDFVGAMGFAIHEPGCRLAFGDAYEDQQPYRLEVTAIWHLLRAISAAKDRSSGLHPWVCQDVICVVDCESAITAIEGKRDFDLMLVLQDIRHFRQRLLGQGIDVSFVWCPSHGKRPKWAPPLGLDPQTLRELNTAADVVAG